MALLTIMGVGGQELFIIIVAIMFLFGGKKLPELARGLGRGIREFKDASEGIKREIADQINNFEKDLDVKVEENSYTNVDTSVSTTENGEIAEGQENEESQNEKKIPQFSAPSNTFQHDPGAHPVDESEYYKYGYNDHFNADEKSEENSPSIEELPKKADTTDDHSSSKNA